MKTILFFTFLYVSALPLFAQRYVADAKQSKFTWTGYSEVGSYTPSGTLQLQQGILDITGTQISRGRIDMDMRTIQHENSKMQEHLRSEDFFNAPAFPTATFVIQQMSGTQISGQLTIKGVTKPISFPVVVTKEGGELRIQGKVTIDRTLYGIKYNSSSFFSGLGDYAIKNTFDLSFDIVAQQVSKPTLVGSALPK